MFLSLRQACFPSRSARMSPTMPSESPPTEILDALRRMHLLDARSAPGERLTGGVSSDIWRIDLPDRPDLREARAGEAARRRRLARAGRAQSLRSRLDAARQRRRPRQPPRPCSARTKPAARWRWSSSPPADHPLWKTQLRDGHADPAFAAQVATSLARIHAATAADPTTAAQFPTDRIFFDIRLEPYLLATARAHPDLAPQLEALVATTQDNKRALVHGDVSPKNILRRPARAGVPRRRVRLVGRSGVRPRVLPQPPVAEMSVDAVRHVRLPRLLRCAGSTPISPA